MTLALLLVLATTTAPKIECPAYPGDPPWRIYTCRILTVLTEPPTRPPWHYQGPEAAPDSLRWK